MIPRIYPESLIYSISSLEVDKIWWMVVSGKLIVCKVLLHVQMTCLYVVCGTNSKLSSSPLSSL
jgi:hypothetical protein